MVLITGIDPRSRRRQRISEITVHWPDELNEHGWPLLWFGSWLVGTQGQESTWFYSGRGNEVGHYSVPAGVTGVRIRKWPSEGIDAEYVDVALNGAAEFWPSQLNFDVTQPHSRLPERYDRESQVRSDLTI